MRSGLLDMSKFALWRFWIKGERIDGMTEKVLQSLRLSRPAHDEAASLTGKLPAIHHRRKDIPFGHVAGNGDHGGSLGRHGEVCTLCAG
jgi:hypothetical protein